MIRTYKDLIVWQKAMDLVVVIYQVTNQFPNEEKFGLVSQMRRCAVSIPSNIAEGKLRGSPKEFRRFLEIAYGSVGELQTQLELVKRLSLVSLEEIERIETNTDEVCRILDGLILTVQ